MYGGGVDLRTLPDPEPYDNIAFTRPLFPKRRNLLAIPIELPAPRGLPTLARDYTHSAHMLEFLARLGLREGLDNFSRSSLACDAAGQVIGCPVPRGWMRNPRAAGSPRQSLGAHPADLSPYPQVLTLTRARRPTLLQPPAATTLLHDPCCANHRACEPWCGFWASGRVVP